MMDLAPILTGIAVAGLICQATAVPVPFKVEAILPQAEGAPYATMAAQIGKDMLASLIPYRVLKNGGVTYHLGDKSTPPLQVWAQEKLTGLTIFKVEPARIYDGQADLTPPGILKRGDKLSFASSKNETTQGIYVGMEHSIGDTSFPLRLIRAQFPKLAVPPIGQPCYDSENRLVGIVLGVSRKGTCHLLPARAISFLATIRKPKECAWVACWTSTPQPPSLRALSTEVLLHGEEFQTGDILININDTPIRNYGDMLDATYYLTGDKPLSIEVIRGTQVVTSKGILPTQDPR